MQSTILMSFDIIFREGVKKLHFTDMSINGLIFPWFFWHPPLLFKTVWLNSVLIHKNFEGKDHKIITSRKEW